MAAAEIEAPAVVIEDDSHYETHSMLEKIVPELHTRILGFLNVKDRMVLSICSSLLHKRVTTECKEAWQVISFRPVEPIYKERLSDGMLSTLLTKVNAKHVTTSLFLTGCKNIRGAGLSALRFSTVLAKISLKGTGANKSISPFLWVLQTLLPYKLTEVRVDYKLFDEETRPQRERQALVEFLWKLKEAKLNRAQDTICSCCQEQPVFDPNRQVIPMEFGVSEAVCDGCNNAFCKTPSCSMAVRECEYCHETYCDSCNMIGQCSFCGSAHCKVDSCGGTFTSCTGCDKICCRNCQDDLVDCAYCKKRKTCLECAAKNQHCQAEEEKCVICTTCQDKSPCSVCAGDFCIQCIAADVRQCKDCYLVFCDKPACAKRLVEWCKAPGCNQIFCKTCRDFEYCLTCDSSFCLIHDRLVDCFQCGMRHCRSCSQTRQCQLCGRGCHEDCICAATHAHIDKKQKTTPNGSK